MNQSFDNNELEQPECPPEYQNVFLAKYWNFEQKFTNLLSATKYVEMDHLWIEDPKRSFATPDGYKKTYQCNKVGAGCSATKCVFCPTDQNEVVLFQSTIDHDHSKSETKYKNWKIVEHFFSLEDVKNYLESKLIWSLQSKSEVVNGTRYHYRCNQVPANGPQCAAKMFFFHCAKSSYIPLNQYNTDHTHDSIQTNNTVAKPITQKRKSIVIMQFVSDADISTLHYRGFKLMSHVLLKDCLSQKTKDVFYQNPVEKTINPENKEIFIFDDDTNYVVNFKDTKKKKYKKSAKKLNHCQDKKLRKIRPALDSWTFKKSFDTAKSAENYIESLKIWSKFTSFHSRSGIRQKYYCNLDSLKCLAKISLVYKKTKNWETDLFQNQYQHTCSYKNKTINQYSTDTPIVDLTENELVLSTKPIDQNDKKSAVIVWEWILVNKFDNLEKARTYLSEICVGGTVNLKYMNTDMEYYTCGLDPSNPCLALEYNEKNTEVMLHKNINMKHDVFTLTSNLDQNETIINWFNSESKILTSDQSQDKAFIINPSIDYQQKIFQCFITTRRLLKMALITRIILVDYEPKTKWQNYSILVMGTTDMDQKFHTIGVCVSRTKSKYAHEFAFRSLKRGLSLCHKIEYQPKIVVCNTLSVVQNVIKAIYKNKLTQVFICHEFMSCEIAEKLALTVPDETNRNEILDDIKKIQQLHTSDLFFKAVTFFVKKWSAVTEFIEYFKKAWVNKINLWYSGVLSYAPTTIASHTVEQNRIYDESVTQLHCTIRSFKKFMFKTIESCSNAYANELKTFAEIPTISIALYEEACLWNLMQNEFDIQEINPNLTYYFIPNNSTILDRAKLMDYKLNRFNTLERLFDIHFSFIQVQKINNADLICCCPYFVQHFCCIHSMRFGNILKKEVTPIIQIDDVDMEHETSENVELILP